MRRAEHVAHAAVHQIFLDVLEVLLREDLGGGHDGRWRRLATAMRHA